MLTQLSQSSKRLGKLKKYRTKLKESGFQFLLQSLDRDKENHVPNAQNNNQLVQSVQIDPILTAPAHSLTLNLASTINNSKKGNFFLENVKVLDKSDMSIKDTCQQKNSKKSKKDRDNCSQIRNASKKKRKNSSQFLSNESKNTDKSLINQIISKMKEYITTTNDLVLPKQGQILQKKYRKCKKLESQLISLITNIQQQEQKQRKSLKMRNSVNTTCFNIFGNDVSRIGKGSQQYLKIINSLEFEKEKLNSLISRHELANIKMFIKINEGQSQQIQMCKRQLAMLFDKYKKLQSLISNDRRKIIQITKEKQVLILKNTELTFQNQELLKILETSQLHLQKKKENNNIRLQKRKNNYSELEVNRAHARQQSIQSIYENSLNNGSGDLHLQSLNNSQFSEEHGLGSSITTTTSRMFNKKGGRLGINLNALLENTKQSNINKLIEDPQKLKKMMNECRSNIVTMENIINQQNKQLEFSVKALEQNKIKNDLNESTIKSLQAKIRQLNKLMQKMKLKQKTEKEIIQKQNDKNKCFNESRSFRNNKQIDYRQSGRQQKKENIVEGKDKRIVNIDLNSDFYRIIALQAQTIQQMYCPSKRI